MGFRFPPRPKGRLAPGMLSSYDNGLWDAQRKYNGTRNCIEITPKSEVVLWNRHNELHKQYNPPPSIKEQILSLNLVAGQPYYFDSELMHAKTTKMKGKIVLFDILQAGNYLFGISHTKRQSILSEICRHPKQYIVWGGINFAFKITDDLWLAETFSEDFVARYKESFDVDELEGLLLRRRNSTLDVVGSKAQEVTWKLRVRKPHKNYDF